MVRILSGLVGDVDLVSDLRPVLGVGLRGEGGLDDILGILGFDDLHAFCPDRCRELLVDFTCVFLRHAIGLRKGDCRFGLQGRIGGIAQLKDASSAAGKAS